MNINVEAKGEASVEPKMARWDETYPGAAGYLPSFLNVNDPRKAVDQIHDGYAHGGGWQPFKGFALDFDPSNPRAATITYPGDPKYTVVAHAKIRDEVILLFQYSWVVVVQPDGSFAVARCD